MHYTGMAAVHAQAADPGLVVSTADTASASGFLLPLILGLSSLGFIFSAVIALSPTAAEIVEEDALMRRIGQSQMARARLRSSEARPGGQAGPRDGLPGERHRRRTAASRGRKSRAACSVRAVPASPGTSR